MAITIGIIQELHFVAKSLHTSVVAALKTDLIQQPIFVKIDGDILEITYDSKQIWRENLRQPQSMFGVESCSEIAKIVFLIDNKNSDWQKHIYIEK